jgi:hypothetical protein
MQTLLVILTFAAATGYLLKKFVWNPVFETRQKSAGTLDGDKTKCGKSDCGCH